MSALKNVIYLSNEDYNTLISTGTVTINGTTLTYDENNVYITPDPLATTTDPGLMSAADKVKLDDIINRTAAESGEDLSLVTTGDKYRWDHISGDNQTIKGNGTSFGVNEAVNIVPGTNVSVTAATSGDGAPKITIASTNTTYTLTQPQGEANKVVLTGSDNPSSPTTITINNVAHATAADSATNATNATEATHAVSADSATTATSANTAGNTTNLDGHPSSYYAVDTNVVHKTGDETISGTKTFNIRPELVGSRLPNTYQEVNYLSFNGSTGYVDTGIVITVANNLSIEIDANWRGNNTAFATFFGYMKSTSEVTPRCAFSIYSNRYMIGINSTTSSSATPVSGRHIYKFYTTSGGQQILDVNNITAVSTSYSSDALNNNQLTSYIAARNTANTAGNFADIDIYSVKIIHNNISYDLVPCYRKSDNQTGFYDTIHDTFLPSTGGVTKGDNISASTFMVANDFAAVAFTGEYSALKNIPTIPTGDNQTIKAKNLGGTDVIFGTNATIELTAGSNITLTPNNTTNTIEIAADNTTYENLSAAQGGTDVSLVTTGEKYTWNDKISSRPDGTNLLLTGTTPKINTVYLPDYILGQLIYGGTLNASTTVATLSADAKAKLNTSSNTITLTANTATTTGWGANKGIYYIVATAGTVFQNTEYVLSLEVGDWLLSDGLKWTKIDNTDAVSSVQIGANSPLSSSTSTAQTGNVSTTISHNKVLGDTKATTTAGIYGIAIDTYGHITDLNTTMKLSSSRVDDGNPYQTQVGATRFVTPEMYEYLDDKLYQRPAISTFTLYNNGSAVSTTVEKGTTVTVGQIRHLETNIGNIATLKLDSENITPVSSTTTANLATALTITSTTTKTLSGTNTKGESFTKTATINVYSYAYSRLDTSTTTPTSLLTKQSVYTTFQSSGASFSYLTGQYLYLYVPTVSTATKMQTNVLGQWVDVAYTNIGTVTITKANNTTESYKCFRTTGTFSSAGTATYRVA